jgi:hypothetical protein
VQHQDAAESLRVTEGDVLGIATVRTHRGLALLRERRHEDAVHALRAVLEVPGIEQLPVATAVAAGETRPTACVAMAGLALTALRRLGEEFEGVEATALDEAIVAARIRAELEDAVRG